MVRLFVPLAAGALLLAACGGDDSSSGGGNDASASSTSTSATRSTSAPDASAASFTVAVRKTALGDTLVDGDGRTLYAFKNDSNGKSTCSAGCETAWPPLTVTGELRLGPGLDADDFAVITRDDGTKQVADYGQPLYRFSGDTKPGDTNGDGVGGVWYAVNKEGKPASAGSTGASAATTTTGPFVPGY